MIRHAGISLLAILMAGCNKAPSQRGDDQPQRLETKAPTSTPVGQRAKATTPAVPVQAKDDTPKLDDFVGDWVTPGFSLKIERGGKGTYFWLFSSDDNFSEVVGDLTLQLRDGKVLVSMSPTVFGQKRVYHFVAKLSGDKMTIELEETKNQSKPKTLKKKAAGIEKDLPKEGPGDPKITYDEVSKDPEQYHGKRVTWPALATTGAGKEAAVAVNPEASDSRKYRMYSVRFATDAEVSKLFLGGKGKITGTVAGKVTISYEVTGPGGVGKEQRKETVPLLVHPKFEPDKK